MFGPETCVNKKLNARRSLREGVKKVVNRVATEYQYPCYHVISTVYTVSKAEIPFQKEKNHTVRLACVDLCSIHFKSHEEGK